MLRCDGAGRNAGGSGQRARRSSLLAGGPKDGVDDPSTLPTTRELLIGLEKSPLPRLVSPGDGRHRLRIPAPGGSGFLAITLALGMKDQTFAGKGQRESPNCAMSQRTGCTVMRITRPSLPRMRRKRTR